MGFFFHGSDVDVSGSSDFDFVLAPPGIQLRKLAENNDSAIIMGQDISVLIRAKDQEFLFVLL